MRKPGTVGSRKKAGSLKKIDILLVEDNRLLRDGIEALINAQSDLKIAATSGGNHDTLLTAQTVKPQVVLMDLGLRNENGVHLVTALTRELPHTKVIGMGLVPSQLDIAELVQAGAVGFILKDATIDNVLSTIRSVARGEKVLPPMLTGSLFSHVVEHAQPRGGKRELANAVRMTKREREIIVLIAEAMSNKEIADRLNLSTYTVKSHIHNILEKMALHSRLEIATYSYGDKGE
jgi:DNA-binding NarL/FixJ family response regulator